MFFTDIEFFIFLPTVLLLYWLSGDRYRHTILLASSYIFYCYVVPWIGLVMLFVTFVNWIAARKIDDDRRRAKFWLWSCVGLSLIPLIWFKYTIFILDNLKEIWPNLNLSLQIFLPAGISFFTFQALAYTTDVYRGEIKAERSFSRFALFIAFFPQLVAGPIERSANLLQQLRNKHSPTLQNIFAGIDLLLLGYIKKVVVADNVATYVNMIFDLKEASPLFLLVGGIGFSIQILADFSAYTDIARGSAKMFGFNLLENFNHPYLAKNPGEFWSRWHISLSNCIRDYIYIPLGGSRVNVPRYALNLLIVWFICGLWHGAGWNFVIWGLYWGALIFAYRFITLIPEFPLSNILRISIMYLWIVLGWIIFRAKDLASITAFTSDKSMSLFIKQLPQAMTVLTILCTYALPLIIVLLLKKIVLPKIKSSQAIICIRILGYFSAALLITIFMAETSEEFYYFQF